MAVMDCPFGHGPDCNGHAIQPLLKGLPNADPPKAGRCPCGEIGYLWQVPVAKGYYCKRCIRGAMRRATWPATIRFPDEVG